MAKHKGFVPCGNTAKLALNRSARPLLAGKPPEKCRFCLSERLPTVCSTTVILLSGTKDLHTHNGLNDRHVSTVHASEI